MPGTCVQKRHSVILLFTIQLNFCCFAGGPKERDQNAFIVSRKYADDVAVSVRYILLVVRI